MINDSSNERIEAWRRRGSLHRVREHDVFAVHDRYMDGTPALLLHGFPTSGFDWRFVHDALAKDRPVLTADLPGFGLSSKPALYEYSLIEQARVLIELWTSLGITRAHLVAHDMGTSVACELLALREENKLPITLESVTLSNGSVHLEMAKLTPSQKLLRRPLLGQVFARLSNQSVFELQFRRLFAKLDALDSAELAALWSLLTRADGTKRLPRIIRYLDERIAQAPRWLPPLTRLDLPTMVLWGRQDPVAVYAIAERLSREIPASTLVTLQHCGHYPMLEDSAAVTTELRKFFAKVEGREP